MYLFLYCHDSSFSSAHQIGSGTISLFLMAFGNSQCTGLDGNISLCGTSAISQVKVEALRAVGLVVDEWLDL